MKKYILLPLTIILALSLSATLVWWWQFWLPSRSAMYESIAALPPTDIALILGAGVRSDKKPGILLKDRLETAVEAYQQGKIRVMIVSGDNRSDFYNEPKAMQDYLLSRGIPQGAIVLDYAGIDTYDSIWRAHAIFGADNLAIFSQKFHLPRALYLSRKLGLSVVWVESDRSQYDQVWYRISREAWASVKALYDGHMLPNAQHTGSLEPIILPSLLSQ